MALSPAVRAAIAVPRRRPDDLLRAFLPTPAVSAVGRVVAPVGVALAYAHLGLTGRLERFRGELADRRRDPPDPNTEPEAFAERLDGVAPLLESLLTSTTVGILAATPLLSLVVVVVIAAVATAARLTACRAPLDDERGTTAAIRGSSRHRRSIPGLLVAEGLRWLAATGIAVAGVVAVAQVSPLAGALGLLLEIA